MCVRGGGGVGGQGRQEGGRAGRLYIAELASYREVGVWISSSFLSLSCCVPSLKMPADLPCCILREVGWAESTREGRRRIVECVVRGGEMALGPGV